MAKPSRQTGRTFGRVLRSARIAQGLTHLDVIEKLSAQGIHAGRRNLQRIEADATDPRASLLCALILALQITPRQLRLEDLVGTPWRPPQ